jgi:quercetin dioxygenase-like cupin family protein
MKHIAFFALSVVFLGASICHAQEIEITPSGSQSTAKGSTQSFAGTATIDFFAARDPMRVSVGRVTFEPGARTAWHTHPAGQILIVTAGTGWIQQWGGKRRTSIATRIDRERQE